MNADIRRLCFLVSWCLGALVVNYSARDAAACECRCGVNCPGACCDCGCSELVPVLVPHKLGTSKPVTDVVPCQCPGGRCPLNGGCPNGQCGMVPVPQFSPAAEAPAANEKTSPIVRIKVADRNGMTSWGSGVVIDANGKGQQLVITNNHVVKDGSGSVEVLFRDGKRHAGTVQKTDAAFDLAAIAINEHPGVTPLELAEALPAVGAALSINGFGGEGQFKSAAGKLAGYVQEDNGPQEFLKVSAVARPGDSGGPILDESGHVVGLLNAAEASVGTVGVNSVRIRGLLVQWFPRIRCGGSRRGGEINIGSVAPQPTPIVPAPAAAGGPLPGPAYDLEGKFASVHSRLDAVEKNIAAKLDKLPAPVAADLKPLTSGLQSAHEKLDALVTNAGVLTQRAAAVKDKLDAIAASDVGQAVKPIVDSAVAKAVGPLVEKLAAPVAAELGLPTVIGLGAAGGVPGLIAAVGLFMVRNALKKKLTADRGRTPRGPTAPPAQAVGLPTGPDGPIVLSTQSPPPPQRVEKETNYVQVPVDTPELEGLRMGMEELALRQPGSITFVEQLQSYAKQFTSGLKAAKA